MTPEEKNKMRTEFFEGFVAIYNGFAEAAKLSGIPSAQFHPILLSSIEQLSVCAVSNMAKDQDAAFKIIEVFSSNVKRHMVNYASIERAFKQVGDGNTTANTEAN